MRREGLRVAADPVRGAAADAGLDAALPANGMRWTVRQPCRCAYQQRACPMVQRGELVTASTDMGHEGQGGTWGASDPQLRVDFAYRGVHATALVAKALITHFYGQPPRWSYFSGCSDGGREGMMEAQRYPDDFDGIAAGAPAFNFLVQNSFYHAWNARSVSHRTDATPVLRRARPADAARRGARRVRHASTGLNDGIVVHSDGVPLRPGERRVPRRGAGRLPDTAAVRRPPRDLFRCTRRARPEAGDRRTAAGIGAVVGRRVRAAVAASADLQRHHRQRHAALARLLATAPRRAGRCRSSASTTAALRGSDADARPVRRDGSGPFRLRAPSRQAADLARLVRSAHLAAQLHRVRAGGGATAWARRAETCCGCSSSPACTTAAEATASPASTRSRR